MKIYIYCVDTFRKQLKSNKSKLSYLVRNIFFIAHIHEVYLYEIWLIHFIQNSVLIFHHFEIEHFFRLEFGNYDFCKSC